MKAQPKALAEAVASQFLVPPLRPYAGSEADHGLTNKTLFELDGGHSVEAVVMRYADRSTLCISSQAGCPIGCPLCPTREVSFGRNPKAHENLEPAGPPQRGLAAGRGPPVPLSVLWRGGP